MVVGFRAKFGVLGFRVLPVGPFSLHVVLGSVSNYTDKGALSITRSLRILVAHWKDLTGCDFLARVLPLLVAEGLGFISVAWG